MTARIVIRCDGTPDDRPGMSLETCRAYFPSRFHFEGSARNEAIDAGWQYAPRRRDLCPACSRASTDQHRKDPTQ